MDLVAILSVSLIVILPALITIYIGKRGHINDLTDIILSYMIPFFILLGIASSIGFYYDDHNDTYETDIYIDNISDINSNRIILENGTVLFIKNTDDFNWKIGKFVKNIDDFNWKIGKIHKITIETHKDYNARNTSFKAYQKIIDVEIIEKEKKINDRNKEARTLQETKSTIC
jgi:hypothetical protein